MRYLWSIVLLGAILLPSTAAAEGPSLLGFTEGSAAEQRVLEERFDAQLSADNLREWARRMSSRPHHVGSPWGKANAEWMAEQFRSWGYDVRIETFDVLFPTPIERAVTLLEPARFEAALSEPVLAEDSTSGQRSEQLPVYNAYSIDGDVTGELVYVNYGVAEDYEELKRRGIDVSGKIVIARYGGSWRGIKPKVAAEKGAIGCLIYSDPRDDGYYQGDSYPDGGYRSEEGAQRGSVADMPLYPGDPLTPGVGATEGARRLPLDEARTLTKIPVLPLAAVDAQPLLEALGGPVAPRSWRGALPLTYHLGAGPAKVRLKVAFDWSRVPAYDVIAVMPGAERPDEWVVRGNHHDAWVNGATDPVSGMVAVLEEARAIGALAKEGFRPNRTLVFVGWDAEEPGLLGSVEWTEQHAEELREKVVAYVNSDSNSRGYLSMGGSHTLQRLMNEVARDVPDPKHEVSVAERLRAHELVEGDAEEQQRALEDEALRLSALGSGSDYTPFLQHLGVASLNLSFGGEGHYGQYHSIYDSYDHYVRFMDPDFAYGVALAKVAGRTVLRLAQADLLPFEFTAFSETLARYVDEIEELVEELRTKSRRHNQLLDRQAFSLTAPPDEVRVDPPREDDVPFLNLAPLHNAATRLQTAAEAYDRALVDIGPEAPPEARRATDAILLKAEQALTRPQGLPGRRWFVHYVYAPGFYTGYGVKTLPAVREAIEQRQWDEVDAAVAGTAGVLEAFAGEVEKATSTLRGAGR